ncbi:MAG: sigma 54-interacting transcriptional regulator [Acidobacteriota bacterium]
MALSESLSSSRSSSGLASGRAPEGLSIASRLLQACPSPAFLIAEGGSLLEANAAAVEALGLGGSAAGLPIRDLLGVGWRELLVIAKAGRGGGDLVADMAIRGQRRSARVRLEPIETGAGPVVAAFLELASERRASERAERPAAGFESIFGHDPELLATKEAAARFARTLLPILLLAETGTGKELLARALHEASPRSQQPFVAINCGALSAHLLESELFGYAPGAFTGASREGHEGKIGSARGGTLFLDEVAEMPGPLQALLLRVLEDGTYYRVGESVPRQADVRLICATCRDLPHLVADGAFRQDLFYRIHGVCLSLPPVRRRRDVSDLIDHLLDRLAEPSSAPRAPLSEEARALMVESRWPGNVRQLKTALQHALILSDGGEIRVEHLPARVETMIGGRTDDGAEMPGAAVPGAAVPGAEGTGAEGTGAEGAEVPEAKVEGAAAKDGEESQPAERGAAGAATPPAAEPRGTPSETLAERQLRRLVEAVEASGGNLSRASKSLGIARSTLYRRLRKHGLIE